MTFSSPLGASGASTAALRGYWRVLRFFVLVVLLVLVGLVRLFLGDAVRSALGNEKRREPIQGNNLGGVAFVDGGARHAANHAGLFTLRDGQAAGGFNGAQSFGAVFTHAGHDYADGQHAKFLGHGMEEHVRGRPVAVDRGSVGEYYDISASHAPYHHVAVTGAQEHASGQQQITGFGFLHKKRRAIVQSARKHFREAFGHVLDDDDGGGKIRGNL